jgi:hypothetical protein
MGEINQEILDSIIQTQLDLYRLDAGTRKQVINILMKMQAELVAKLASNDLTEFSRQRLNQLLKESKQIIEQYYTMAEGQLSVDLHGAGRVTSGSMASSLTQSITLDAKLPTETFFKALASNVLIQGAPAADWWERQSVDTAFRFANEVRQGLAQGETNTQIIARVVGKRGFPGIMEIARNNAAALVQTSVQSVANAARLETFRRNADIITGLIWLTALDGHVCPLCMARADKEWTNTEDGTHEPVGHSLPFQNPPIHFNDRCVLVPVTKTFKELGLDIPEPKTGTRSSSEGQVSADTTFEAYLKRRTVAEQDAQLGHGRAQLWRDGTITLQQLVNGQGRELTLAELHKKY